MTNNIRESEYPPEDVLVKSALHRTMLFFHIPAGWSGWLVSATLIVPLIITGLIWTWSTGQIEQGLLASFVLALFYLADALLLINLPKRSISFGPWQSQSFVLAVPRTAAAFLCGLVPLLIFPAWAFAALIGVQLAGSLALIYGALLEPFRLEMTYLTVETDRLAPDQQPVRILHISDLHIERLTRREDKLLKLIDEAQAELILITGDYLNLSYVRDRQAQADVRQLLGQISAPYGVYAVLGSPPVDERAIVPPLFDDLAVQLLVNESQVLELDGGRQLLLLGLDCSHDIPVDAKNLEAVISAAPTSEVPAILLYHAPDLMPQAAGHGIDLYLCGHTHGGQVRLPFIGAILTSSQLGKRYEMGLYREKRTLLYVSRGIGLEGLSAPRVRFLAPPEIVLITLQGKQTEG